MKKQKRKGLLLAPDDLVVGKFIAVHSAKRWNEPLAIAGVASEVMAINLPFVVVRPVVGYGTETLDVRHLNLMPVTDDFVRAQQAPQQPAGGTDQNPLNTDKQSV
jgi:hypothetical protein